MSENQCVFCDRAKLEERLIGEDKNHYIIASLGQITDGGYTLIVPKRHVSCIGAMNEQEIFDIDGTLHTVSNSIKMEYGIRPIFFEHGIVGQTVKHAHLHVIPAQIYLSGRIYNDFPNEQICFLNSLKMLRWVYKNMGQKYLLWSTPELLLKVVVNPSAPLQYFRLIIAELLGKPERGNWRNMDPELDKRLGSETVTRLKKYF